MIYIADLQCTYWYFVPCIYTTPYYCCSWGGREYTSVPRGEGTNRLPPDEAARVHSWCPWETCDHWSFLLEPCRAVTRISCRRSDSRPLLAMAGCLLDLLFCLTAVVVRSKRIVTSSLTSSHHPAWVRFPASVERSPLSAEISVGPLQLSNNSHFHRSCTSPGMQRRGLLKIN